jgi:hypothetical protein
VCACVRTHKQLRMIVFVCVCVGLSGVHARGFINSWFYR